MCAYVFVEIWTHMWGDLKARGQHQGKVILFHGPPDFLRQGPSQNMKYTNLAKMAGQQVPGSFLYAPGQWEDYSHLTTFT